jgi:uncharacterized membrane protein (UPF0127 family)
LAAGAARGDASNPEPLSAFPQSLLAIRTTTGRVINFKIWTADNSSRKEQGLMYVREMDDHAGMLFVFPADENITMWMKNTVLSLDLLFIGTTGRIDYIAARAVPFSLDIIAAPQPEHAVLELKGGICDQLGIKVGDRIVHPSFKSTR